MDFAHAAQAVAGAVLPRRTSPVVHILDRVVTWGVRLTVALVPVAVSPWTFEVLEFGKQSLLLGAAVVLTAAWLARCVIAREVRTPVTPLNWAVLALAVVAAVSTVFSVDWVTSTFGFYGRFNGGLVSLVAYALIYFLVLQVASDEHEVRAIIGSWLIGVGAGAAVLGLQLFGIKTLPLEAAASVAFNPLSRSLNSVVLVLAASFPLALFFARQARSQVVRALALIFTVAIAALTFLVDYQLGWLGLLIAAVLWLAAVFWKNEPVGLPWTLVPALAVLLAVVGWPLRTPALTQVAVPVEVNLSFRASWQVASQGVRQNPLLGTGPETFIYGFSKYKPESFNDSDFWAFRFDKASSELAQAFTTTGILGLAVLSALMVVALYLSWRAVRDRDDPTWFLRAALVGSFAVFLVGQVFYFASTTTALGWWVVLGLSAALTSVRRRELSLAASPRASFAFSFGVAVVVLMAAAVCFGLTRVVAADVAYARTQQALRAGALDEAEASLVRAVRLNPLRDVYYIALAQVRLALANREAQQPLAQAQPEQQAQLARLQGYLRSSIEAAQAATALGRENVANWEALGSVYRGSALYAQDAERWVIDSFQNAILREPKNPALYTEVGRAYLIAAARKRQAAAAAQGAERSQLETEAASLVTKALEQFDHAIKLKANYTPAHFNQALAYEQQGKVREAIDKLESMRRYNPQDVDVLYELGSVYYSEQRYTEASEVFAAITQLVPNHVNAFYSLGLSYEQQGRRDEAIAQLEKVLTLLPQDSAARTQVQEQLGNLRSGGTTKGATPPAGQP